MFVSLVSFLPNYVTARELARFVWVWSAYKWGAVFPLLPSRLQSALAHGTVDRGSVLLGWPQEFNDKFVSVQAVCRRGSRRLLEPSTRS